MKCFYHMDLDGKCAAAIVHKFNKGEPDDYIGINYNMPFPLERVNPDEWVYIVDFSLSVEDMHALLARTRYVVWIDHHRTAIERFAGDDRVNGLLGIRDTSEAGCVLTWRYFSYTPVPEAVVLVGDRDIWRWAFGDQTKFFNSGMYAVENHPTAPIWESLLWGEHVDNIINDGITIERYREKWFAGFRKAWAFESEFEGHRCICMNLAQCGSEAFGDTEKEYPILLSYAFNGKQITVSLYSAIGVDVGRLAEKYGGGGHPGAAGFQIDAVRFLEMITPS